MNGVEFNNLKMSCNNTNWGVKKFLRTNKCLIFGLVFICLISSSVGAPANNKPFSRSLRELSSSNNNNNYNVFKNMQATTLHSLQGVAESGSSLSIVSPLDVLRQNMVIEIIRRRMRHAKQKQLQSNKEILDRIG